MPQRGQQGPLTNSLTAIVIDDWDDVCARSPTLDSLPDEVQIEIFGDKVDRETTIRRLADADIVIPIRERTRFDAGMLEALPKLRLIAQTGGAATHIDVEAARRLGIEIRMTPAASAVSVAELTLGLMLAVCHRIAEGDRALRAKTWPTLLGRDLNGRSIGLAGFGAVGREVAVRALAFGARVCAWSRTLSFETAPPEIAVVTSLDDLLDGSEILSLHLPLTSETRGLITSDKLARMQKGAILINTARGGLVDEAAMIRALNHGPLGGAGLDVFPMEPLSATSPLLHLPNVVLTPHVGWTTRETLERYLIGVVENIRKFLQDARGPVSASSGRIR